MEFEKLKFGILRMKKIWDFRDGIYVRKEAKSITMF
jgi:hypothetical protein